MICKGREHISSIFLCPASIPRPDTQPNAYRIKEYLLERSKEYVHISPKVDNQVEKKIVDKEIKTR